jgi:hypothetical protein
VPIYTGPPYPKSRAWTKPITLQPGSNTVFVKATDRARHHQTKSLTLCYDAQKPSLAITSPLPGSHRPRALCRVTGTAADTIGLRSVRLRLNSNSWKTIWSRRWAKTGNWQTTVTLASGRNVIMAQATDMSQRIRTASVVVWLDGTTVRDTTATPVLALAGLSAQPTRAGGVSCTLVLSAAATVRAEVLNLAGRPVATLVNGSSMPQGMNTLLWNGRSASGLAVPGGTYLIRVQANASDGKSVRALTTVSLNR